MPPITPPARIARPSTRRTRVFLFVFWVYLSKLYLPTHLPKKRLRDFAIANICVSASTRSRWFQCQTPVLEEKLRT